METKVIFIDVDGPLVTDKWFNSEGFKLSTGSSVPYKWDPNCCKALSDIELETDCKFVISSDWRLHYSLDEMRELFWKYSLNGAKILGFTENINRFSNAYDSNRTLEITNWVDRHRIEKWCAIDDLPLQVKNFVEVTDTEMGLNNPELIKKAIDYLKW